MKKFKFLGLVLLTTIAIVSCKNSFGLNIEEEAEEKVDVNVQNLLSKTRVSLFDGVEISDLGISDESRENRLVSEISRKANRSVNSAEPIIELEKVAEILNETVSSVDIPELLEPTEEDIAKIQETFLDLTEEEVIENLDTISRIYQDEISALTMPQIVSNVDLSENSVEARSTVTIDYGNGAFRFSDENGNEINSLTIYELGALLKHPFSALGIKKQTSKALELTTKYMGSKDIRVDNKFDAFRHSIWNFVMCKEGWGRKEEKLSWANDFTTAHEKGIRYEKYSSEMDLHNNNVARLYFSNNSSDKYIKIFRWRIPCGVNSPSYEDACNELRKIAISANFISREDSDFFSKLEKIPNSELIYISEDKQSY